MPGIRDNQIPLYKKDMYKAERETYKEEPTVYDQLYKVKTSVKGAGDKAYQILGAGKLTRHTVEGQKINYVAPKNGWTYYCKYWTYSSGISLTYEAVEDTVKLGNILRDLAESWGKQNRVAKEEHAARPFNQGGNLSGDNLAFNGSYTGETDSSGDLLYDGKPLFNLSGNTRSTINGGTYYNSVAAATSITAANFETLYILHTETNAYDERDEIITNPCDTLVCQSASQEFDAKALLMSANIQGKGGAAPAGGNTSNNVYFGLIDKIIKWRYLNDTNTPWYLMKRNTNAFQFHERQKPKLRFFRDEDNGGYKVSNMLRIGIMIKDFRVVTRGGGTST